MTKLTELLGSERTLNGAWNTLREETTKKFKDPKLFEGHTKSLKMIEDSDGNRAIEAQAREERPVISTVYETLEYTLKIWGKAEDLQFRKNMTNPIALGTVMWEGSPLLEDMPIDELLGLEARLTQIKLLLVDMPTLDATKHWKVDHEAGKHHWIGAHSEDTTKTEKQVIPVVLKEATKEHPAQVQPISKDVVVGRFSKIYRSGAATTEQKSEALKLIDDLLVEVKRARMRANDTKVPDGKISEKLIALLLSPFRQGEDA
jgi:hypothetical protein